ncbi:hypothetical protein FJ420_31895 [Mesorhizobium sp. B3-1-3]|uniref:hypothetical protein n=1 Tax=unclassified Mesorhizobium TaxID=325217 RepID=UPI00112A03E9|nr:MULTISPECIES: hypothetical protein [unclassified Mesorhizobium]TPI53316.1 hypothetical protein FJ424_32290 [Mesorhizobium sp. B3-1-8]TPI60079.1 hypothetical protein FJ420_31895 [Mesorhizobium sp. B3-1-3]
MNLVERQGGYVAGSRALLLHSPVDATGHQDAVIGCVQPTHITFLVSGFHADEGKRRSQATALISGLAM